MTTIFINYRTGDESFAAVMLDKRLSARFGAGAVFRDSRSIPAGTDFEPELWRHLADSAVLVAVIGPHWLTGTGSVNRLESPDDFVRREIAFAVKTGLPIVPVLVGGAPMPDRRDLPDDIKPIVAMQYRRIHARTEEADMNRLVDDLAEQFGEPDPEQPASVVLIGGASAEAVRNSAVDAGISTAVVSRVGELVRVTQPGADRAPLVASDFLRALAGRADATALRVAAFYDEPVNVQLLADPVLQKVLVATSGARLVVLLTEAFHRAAVAPGHPVVDKASFSRVNLANGSTGWVHVPNYPAPRGVPAFQPPEAGRAQQGIHNSSVGNALQANEVHGDVVFGDKVMGDKVIGDKVGGPKIETHHHHGPAE